LKDKFKFPKCQDQNHTYENTRNNNNHKVHLIWRSEKWYTKKKNSATVEFQSFLIAQRNGE